MNPAAVLRQGNVKRKPKAALVQEEKEVLFLCCLRSRYSPILFLACLNLRPVLTSCIASFYLQKLTKLENTINSETILMKIKEIQKLEF